MKKISIVTIILLVIMAAGIVLYTQFTFFVIQPMGMLPEGKTLIISRLDKTNFIDSADAICERMQGQVNLLCRGAVIGALINKTTIYARLPYSKTLYLISTNGKQYDT